MSSVGRDSVGKMDGCRRVQQATAEQVVDVPVPQNLKPIIFEGSAVAPAPQIMEDIEDVIRPVRHALQERIANDTTEHLANVLVPADPGAQSPERYPSRALATAHSGAVRRAAASADSGENG